MLGLLVHATGPGFYSAGDGGQGFVKPGLALCQQHHPTLPPPLTIFFSGSSTLKAELTSHSPSILLPTMLLQNCVRLHVELVHAGECS